MKHLTITIEGNTTTFTARDIFHAAHLVNEHFAAVQKTFPIMSMTAI